MNRLQQGLGAFGVTEISRNPDGGLTNVRIRVQQQTANVLQHPRMAERVQSPDHCAPYSGAIAGQQF
jgi:hypothetical protein